jgi:hypothetical protein
MRTRPKRRTRRVDRFSLNQTHTQDQHPKEPVVPISPVLVLGIVDLDLQIHNLQGEVREERLRAIKTNSKADNVHTMKRAVTVGVADTGVRLLTTRPFPLQGKWASARKRLAAHLNRAEGRMRKYVSAFPMRAKAAVLQAQSLLASEFAALAESQAKAYRSLESGVDQVHTDFRTVTAVPTEYWKLRRSLDSVTGPEREKVLSEIHSLANDDICSYMVIIDIICRCCPRSTLWRMTPLVPREVLRSTAVRSSSLSSSCSASATRSFSPARWSHLSRQGGELDESTHDDDQLLLSCSCGRKLRVIRSSSRSTSVSVRCLLTGYSRGYRPPQGACAI